MEYGLSRIILIDSYLPGRIYEVDVAGHTNILGENNVGKTSLIKLAVLFYGERPTRIGIKQNEALGLDGFSEYYLPHHASYVIFEYLVAGEPRMLVLTGYADRKEAYRRTFVRAGFNIEDFWLPDSDIPLASDVWLKRTLTQTIHKQCSSFEDQTRTLLEGRDPHFSMVPSRVDLTRMKSLMTSMLSRNAGHTELTKIIEEWVKSDLGSECAKNIGGMAIPRKELERWVSRYHNNQKIELNLDRFTLLADTLTEYELSTAEAGGLFTLARRSHQAIGEKIINEERVFKERIEQAQGAFLAKKIQCDQVSKESKVLGSRLQSLQTNEAALTREKEVYRKNVPSNLAFLETQNQTDTLRITQLKSELSDITSGQSEINQWRTAQISEAKTFANEAISKAETAKAKVDSDYHSSLSNRNSIIDDTYEKTVDEVDEQLVDLHSQRENLILTRADYQGQLKSPSLTSDELSSRERLETQLSKADLERSHALKQLEQIKSELTSLKRERDKANEEFKDAHREHAEKEALFDNYQSILSPPSSSFLGFLKSEVPDWQNTHGRALSAEMLQAKGLRPSLVGHSQSSIFGIEVDLSQLPDGELDYTNESELLDRVAVLGTETDVLQREVEKRDQVFTRINKRIDDTQKTLSVQSSQLKNTINQYEQLSAELAVEKDRLKVLLREKSATLIANVEQIDVQLAVVDSQITSLKEQKKQAVKTKQTQKELVRQELQSNRETSISQCDQQKDRASFELVEREAEIESEYTKRLSEKGVDSQYLFKLQKQLKELTDRNIQYQKYASSKEAYESFIADEFDIKMPPLLEELSMVKEEFNAINKSVGELNSELNQLDESKREATHSHEQAIRSMNRAKERLEDKILMHSRFEFSGAHLADETLTVEQICERFESHTRKITTASRLIGELNDELRSLFAIAGTGSFEHLSSNPGNSDDVIQQARRINSYIQDGYHKIEYSSFIQSTLNFERVSLYVTYLEQFKRKITRYNNELNKYMARAAAFNNISQLEVDIVFLFSNRHDWQLVSDIARQYEYWKSERSHGQLDSSRVDLPHRALVDAIQTYLDIPNIDSMDIGELYRYIDFSIRFIDNGKSKYARSFNEILSDKGNASSNGTSYLILITIFVGILNMMRKGHAIHFTWALDELADISPNNITQLLSMLEENDINLISACTVISEAVYLSFAKTYSIEVDFDTGQKVLTDEVASDPILDLISGLEDKDNHPMERAHAE
ncbi:hypothetical protein PULV_a3892 [Pseudoalteromonas ulvae UL12]|uniref:ATP-binding protein n=1 Tax=Pseudoalteromonas ulvae TaxID=107327 RepID=UPI00186B7246|nr:ATP-binding protein [Pseudoalteromonas ulvae]MBE0362097.1 hypothetical protein [Pseudoalteromonas ulvae UL12]